MLKVKPTSIHCQQQQDVCSVFESDTTLRSHLVRFKDPFELATREGVFYEIHCEYGKVYIGVT